MTFRQNPKVEILFGFYGGKPIPTKQDKFKPLKVFEIDEKGRIYSGHNGAERGQYYKQGAYYVKNWGKHGALTNPYAFVM